MNRGSIPVVLPILLMVVVGVMSCDGKGRQTAPPTASVTSVADDTTMTLTATIATDSSMLVDPPPSLIAAARKAESQTAQTPASTATAAGETASATPVVTAPPAAHPGDVNDVIVTLTDYRIALPTTIPAGKTKFKIINHGKTSHSLKLEGNGIEKKLWITLKPGQNATLDADLTPGSYNVYCPVDRHDRKGMRVTLKVTR